MARLYGLVGDTGTGKSTGIATLNPMETFIVNCFNKPLPFKNSANQYSLTNKNMVSTSSSEAIVKLIKEIDTKQKHIRNLIIDDSGAVMSELFFTKAQETGYAKFTELAQAYQKILTNAKDARNDLNVVVVLHEEDEGRKRKVKTIGELLDRQYDPLSVFTVALFTDVEFDKDGGSKYSFITNRTSIGGVIIPAKSPRGMFKELRIPNDLKEVFRQADEYYAGEKVSPAVVTEPAV